LFAHCNGLWAKKIRGKLYYFGVWADPQAALDRYLSERDDLYAGREPRRDAGTGLTVRDLANAFLRSKRHQLDTRQLTAQSFTEYHAACARIVESFGREWLVSDLRPVDFEKLKFDFPAAWGPVRRGKVIQLIRTVFRYASEQDLIDRPVKFGDGFKRPAKHVLRKHRATLKAARGDRMFQAEELRRLIGEAKMPFKAILMLAANTGLGNSEIARLPISALDLGRGWLDFPRPKTGIERRCPLWPETIALLREALEHRPKAKNPADASLAFLTAHGLPWVKVHFHEDKGPVRVVQDDAIAKELRKLVIKLGIQRHGVGFYAVRHGFQTVGEESHDRAAVSFLMGHAEDARDMAAVYREHISDDRLRAVVEHVRRWLFVGPWQE
jgi:integrase